MGAQLATQDFSTHLLEGERLDGGGISKVELQVVGVLTYIVVWFTTATMHLFQ